MMRRSTVLMTTLLLAGGAAAPAAAQDHSAMLENVIPAVVTIGAVSADDGVSAAFGFGDEADSQRASAIAYGAPLYLTGMDASGSGFGIQRNGRTYVVTNAHVIDAAAEDGIYVFTHERKRYPARLVGADTHWDVAVLELQQSAPELRTVSINATPLRVGAPVFAIGNPQGIRPYTITGGIVSGLNRATGSADDGYIQHDAHIYSGNSGGPLIDTRGRVVGLNTAGAIDGPVNLTYISLALSGDRLDRVVNDLITNGRVRRPFLGVHLVSRQLADGTPGIVLVDTLPGSPAAAAGAPAGEDWQIIGVNGEPAVGLREISASLELIPPTAPVQFTLSKAGQTRTITINPRMLDDDALAQIGGFVLQRRYGLTASRSLTILAAPATPPGRWVAYDLEDGEVVSLDAVAANAPQQGDRIAYAGIFTDDLGRIYRASTLTDVGIISRIVMPDAWLSLILDGGDAGRIVSTLVYTSIVL